MKSKIYFFCISLLSFLALVGIFVWHTVAASPNLSGKASKNEFFRSSDLALKPHGGRISLKSLDLSRPPTEVELKMAGELGSPLSPSKSADASKIKDSQKRKLQETDNLRFGQAMRAWNRHEYSVAVKLFHEHQTSQPTHP